MKLISAFILPISSTQKAWSPEIMVGLVDLIHFWLVKYLCENKEIGPLQAIVSFKIDTFQIKLRQIVETRPKKRFVIYLQYI